MKDHELGAALVDHLFIVAQEPSRTDFDDLGAFCRSHGASDGQTGRVVDRLENSGLIDKVLRSSSHNYHGKISAEAYELKERGLTGESVLIARHAYPIEVFNVGDNNTNVQIMNRSPSSTQSICPSRDEALDRLIAGLKDAIQATQELDEQERSDALADAETIEKQASKGKPNWKAVKALLDTMKELKGIGSVVESICGHIGSYLA